jgi:methionyl-tRNA formyltransferase
LRIAILCNDRLGIPALQQLVQNRLAVVVGTSDRSPEMVAIMQQVSAQAHIPAQVFTKKDFEAQLNDWLLKHKPDVVLVKTFPFRIPASALTIPKHGFINFHYAPLPAWRGSNPLFWMIRKGVTTGGIAVHRMDEHFDTGPVLLQQPITFPPDSTFGMRSTQLAYGGAELTAQLLHGLQAGTLTPIPQDNVQAAWYGRPKPADFFIDWNKMNATSVCALVKACNPWLKGAPTRFRGWTICITDASVSTLGVPEGTLPGTLLRLDEQEGCVIACEGGTALKVEVIYIEEGFFAGNKLLAFGLKPNDQFI